MFYLIMALNERSGDQQSNYKSSLGGDIKVSDPNFITMYPTAVETFHSKSQMANLVVALESDDRHCMVHPLFCFFFWGGGSCISALQYLAPYWQMYTPIPVIMN